MLVGCSNPDTERVKKTTVPTYDKKTGKLTELTYDRNKNGVIDTWTDMDGAKPLRSRIDLDKGGLAKVGFSRANNGKADAWAYSGPDGSVSRIEISSAADEHKIDRWEFYAGGRLIRAEEATRGDGRVDKWETYKNAVLETASMDENGDGKPDRRLTYKDGALVLIESEPDVSGVFQRRVEVK